LTIAAPFPGRAYASAEGYLTAYRDEIARAWQSVDAAAFARAAALLGAAIRAGRTIFACGNGGSAAIANHLHCDFLKGIQTATELRPRIVTLSAQIELITAIANDIAYADVFVYPLRTMAQAGDVLMTISSSGNSENVVRAVEWARANEVASIALTGFEGGRTARLAEVNLHVGAANYGVVEDVHQSMMHSLAQYLRQQAMPETAVGQHRF
jgi:phosphoheptose isomerase